MIIRVGLTADTHADEAHRLADHDRVMSFIAADMKARGCTVALHAGDWWERARSSAVERASVANWVREVTDAMPLVGVAGNHDGELDVAWLGRLRTKHRVYAMTSSVVVTDLPVAIACLPWPRKANLLASLGRPASHEEGAAIASDCLRNVIRGLGAQLSEIDAPRIFLGHVMIDGAETDHSQPIVGADMALSLADLSLAGADFYACGHVHAAQRFDIAGAPCVYPSSPRHCNFGEPGFKGYVVATFERTGELGAWTCVDVENVASPCTRLQLFEAAWRDGQLAITSKEFPHKERVEGAECRLRVTVDSDMRDAARDAANKLRQQMLADGAVSVKLEEVVRATTRARAPEIAKATTLEGQLAELWSSKRADLGDERRARLLGKLGEVRS